MSLDLKKTIHDFGDDFLLSQLYHNSSEYTADAIALMESEVASRRISADVIESAKKAPDAVVDGIAAATSFTREQFVALDHRVALSDIFLVQAILEEHSIPAYIKAFDSSPVLPLETEAEAEDHLFEVLVPPDRVEDAHRLTGEHFYVADGRLKVRYSGLKDRLKAVNFCELRLTPQQIAAQMPVDMTTEERSLLSGLAGRLIDEVDAVEQRQERVVFYYDSLEDLVDRLRKRGSLMCTFADFCAILEVLQIYCDDADFPDTLNTIAGVLLDFMEGK